MVDQSMPADRVALYAAVGPVLTRYAIRAEAGDLVPGEAIVLPEPVQYAWPHASKRFLYVASSSGEPGGKQKPSDRHHLTAFAIEPGSGALTPHGAPIALPGRPIHISTDIPSHHVLVAFNHPAALRVYRINPDATLGAEIEPSAAFDPGIYPHQVLVTPDNGHVILPARGHNAEHGKPEEPGSLRVFSFEDGRLTPTWVVAPNGGIGFGPRHVDFHPTEPWLYVALERQNRLDMFGMDAETVDPMARFHHTTLASPGPVQRGQMVGTVHVHPNGRFVYVANRASATVPYRDGSVFAGGENSFAVFAIDDMTGEPTLIQHIDTGGIHCRTFHIDPSGRMLVAAHIMSRPVLVDDALQTIPARLAVFRIGADGRLTFVRAHDVELGGQTLFWMGMVELPTRGESEWRPPRASSDHVRSAVG